MPQKLTNYDAEIINGILRIPPNCAKPTKGEKRRIVQGFHRARRELGSPIPLWAQDVQFLAHRHAKKGRPELRVYVSFGPSPRRKYTELKNDLDEVIGLLSIDMSKFDKMNALPKLPNGDIDWETHNAQLHGQSVTN